MNKPQLPEALLSAGWSLEYDGQGWCKATNAALRLETPWHFPAKHRGLKFILRDIERLSNAQSGISI